MKRDIYDPKTGTVRIGLKKKYTSANEDPRLKGKPTRGKK